MRTQSLHRIALLQRHLYIMLRNLTCSQNPLEYVFANKKHTYTQKTWNIPREEFTCVCVCRCVCKRLLISYLLDRFSTSFGNVLQRCYRHERAPVPRHKTVNKLCVRCMMLCVYVCVCLTKWQSCWADTVTQVSPSETSTNTHRPTLKSHLQRAVLFFMFYMTRTSQWGRWKTRQSFTL